MSAFFQQVTEEQLAYDGFFDGQNIIMPDNTELEAIVYDGFVGIEEGKGLQVCNIFIAITTPGEYHGQKYKYSAKIYDMDAAKRDLAMRNLQVLDAQAGLPMTTGGLDLTTENIEQYWVGKSEFRVKFGLFVAEDDGREINFVRGFAYLRDKMLPRVGMQAQQQQVQQQHAQQHQVHQQQDDDLDIGF